MQPRAGMTQQPYTVERPFLPTLHSGICSLLQIHLNGIDLLTQAILLQGRTMSARLQHQDQSAQVSRLLEGKYRQLDQRYLPVRRPCLCLAEDTPDRL